MKNRPIISIIVPVYNVESYLERCIESILNQSFKEFELILVNDGSTDSCKDICNEYKTKDKRIKVIHKENGGLSSARNAGLDIARGKYIGFVDSDDFINKDMYKTLFNTIQDNNSDMIICDYYKVNEENNDTIIFFCHFGLECVLLSHLLNISPMVLWHGCVAAPSSVTTLTTEERRQGIAAFRMSSFGDISHLYANNEPPAFAARFCEAYGNKDQRHD